MTPPPPPFSLKMMASFRKVEPFSGGSRGSSLGSDEPPSRLRPHPGMPEIPICVALVQSNHNYGLVESFPNINNSQQTLDLTHLSIIYL